MSQRFSFYETSLPSQLLANCSFTNNAINQSLTLPHEARGDVNWKTILLLTAIFCGVNNCYWLTLFNVTNLEGNKFINGLLLGMAELLSGIFAGIIMSHTDSFRAFQVCGVLGIVFNSLG